MKAHLQLLTLAIALCLGSGPLFIQTTHAFVVINQITEQRLQLNMTLPTDSIETIGFGTTSWSALAKSTVTNWNDIGIGPLPDHEFFAIRERPVAADPCIRDGINTVDFRAQPCAGFFWGDTLGITTTRFSTGQVVAEIDIAFNGEPNWDAYTGPLRQQAGVGTITEFTRVALHEFGHALGLDHPDQFGQRVQALMNSRVSDIDGIQSDDENGARAIPFIPNDESVDQRDLSIRLAKVKHTPKSDGDKIAVTVGIRHVGATVPGDRITVSLHRSANEVFDAADRLITSTETTTIPSTPGEEFTVKLKETDLSSLAGAFLAVSVDANARIEELDEENNIVFHEIQDRGCGKDTFLPEDEPNDVPAINQGGIGKLRPAQCVRITGRANSLNADFDGYHFFPRGNQRIEFAMTHDMDTDFDLLFFDFSDAGDALLSCDAATTPEVCAIDVLNNPDGSQRFDIVVVPVSGVGQYTLDIFSVE